MLSSPSRADNPIVQTNYTADPAPMVYDGRLYLYTSHDEDVTKKLGSIASTDEANLARL